jgi:type VI protein secretion system component VasF
MKQMESRGRPADAGPDATRGPRRVVVTAGLVLVGLILIVVAIYTGAFIILVPMMP